MSRVRLAALVGAASLAGCTSRGCARAELAPPPLARFAPEPKTATHLAAPLVFHARRLDAEGKLVPWPEVDAPFHHVVTLGFRAFSAIGPSENGKPPYFSSSMFVPAEDGTFTPRGWLFNPAGLAAMLVRASIRWRAYSGDAVPLARARALVDHVLEHGLTEESDAWSRVPYASANGGELEYGGGDDTKYCDEHAPCGRGDGRGFLEPDKVGELGHALLLLHEATGEARYLDAALRSADALAKHVAPGDATHAPWPFRVDAKTGEVVREPYGTNVIFAIALFDELDRIGRATDAHRRARDLAWSWLFAHPLRTNLWQGYFEDIPIHVPPGENPSQYSAGETARFLLAHPERDPAWRAHVEGLLAWIAETFAVDVDAPSGPTPGHDHGAEAISEQKDDMAKMGSHTARFASLLALLHEKTGDPSLRERAYRSFSWASYCTSDRGIVKVGPDDREGHWFSDGYGDYLPHLLDGIAAIPAWAPAGEDHLLRSSSVIADVAYGAGVTYRAFDADGVEELRMRGAPRAVVATDGGAATFEVQPMASGVHVVVRRTGARAVRIDE